MTTTRSASSLTLHQVLGTLASLAPDRQPTKSLHVPPRDLVGLPLGYLRLLGAQGPLRRFDTATGLDWLAGADRVSSIVKRAQLHREENLLRLGWLWLKAAGEDGELVQFPLVSVALRSSLFEGLVAKMRAPEVPALGLTTAGEPELSDAIADPQRRHILESTIPLGGGALDGEPGQSVAQALIDRLPKLKQWTEDAASAAGYDHVQVIANDRHRGTSEFWKSPYVVVRLAVYLAPPTPRVTTVASSLRAWSSTPAAAELDTAFRSLYRPDEDAVRSASPTNEVVDSTLVLTSAQRDAVTSARTSPVTVVSGPPGSGKTQTIAAIALDAVERGHSVLVAAPTSAAVDALIELLSRTPGPEPTVFGSDERRVALAARLSNGGGPLAESRDVERARDAHIASRRHHEALLSSVQTLLRAEQLVAGNDPAMQFHFRSLAPQWFEAGASLEDAAVLLASCREPVRLLGGIRMRRRLNRVAQHAGSTTSDLDELDAALCSATARRVGLDLQASGGLDLDELWPKLADSDETVRAAKGTWLDLDMRSHDRISTRARSTMGLVAAALRAGRAARRDKLAEIDGGLLTEALPLWAGTLRDIEDLLPRTAGMFDLVIIDEATQVDQVTAAPALLRARRCVVAGDPKQLRHVSFVSDDAIGQALVHNGVVTPADAGRLDVRQVSLFDLASAAARTRLLDQHFRSAPHLISFSARRFYEGKVTIATTHPRNDDRDCITVEQVNGTRSKAGVNQQELTRVIELVRERQARTQGTGAKVSIGVLSPFRAQADAIEAALVEQFTLEEISDVDLRVGTVHGFQGCERDLVIISLALDATDSPNTRAFVSDPNLFNVMVTRAREEVVVVTSLPLTTPGLLGEYLRHGDAAPRPPGSAQPATRDLAAIAADLQGQGIRLTCSYPSGPHIVDLVLGSGERSLGVLAGVHPNGPAEHIERHLQLRRAGWELREVFDTKWAGRRAELALELRFGHQER